ncbi:terpene synthase 10-like [Ziziphus jujuba]|uniref:Terpene synthase 10-like n=1 Tax=Ziziphus jujuba TaxID=326968 RepID=A0ABM3ZXQ6_ZIZJJ|nr:terpene synthase 10-like [Ziziphus jujuba]
MNCRFSFPLHSFTSTSPVSRIPMAIHNLSASLPTLTSDYRLQPFSAPISVSTLKGRNSQCRVKCISIVKKSEENVARRYANYQSTIWHFEYIQSLQSNYLGERYARQVDTLKDKVRVMLDQETDKLSQLELIDMLQRLGLSYHFEEEIKSILKGLRGNNISHTWKSRDLYATALEFRLLRQHGYFVPQEAFNVFKDETGNFKKNMSEDTLGMLSLYEASYYLTKGENILEEARDFTIKNLKKYIEENKDENEVCILVRHALELPIHWRVPRLESRRFIDVYERRKDMNPILLELAKLDFNVVQSTHQQDLKHVSGWWSRSRLGKKLSFARDRLMECFLWTVGMAYEPQFGYFRRMTTKSASLITVIDDVYDVYGTLEELELFTDAVESWNMDAMDQLPDYMKICFLALHNSVNEMAFDALKEQGLHIIKYLKKRWADLCKCYLQEAKWYHIGYTPTFEEYMENAWISIGGPVLLANAHLFVSNPIAQEALQFLEDHPYILRWPSMILRLADDLGTSSDELERGDVPKSIQCYMHETGTSEDDARKYIKFFMDETWKKMNEEFGNENCPLSGTFFRVAMNLGRMAQCMYQHGDGHGVPDGETKDRVLLLLVKPIPI